MERSSFGDPGELLFVLASKAANTSASSTEDIQRSSTI